MNKIGHELTGKNVENTAKIGKILETPAKIGKMQ